MPVPRPFPYRLTIGTDIVHVQRIRTLLTQDRWRTPLNQEAHREARLQAFLDRILTSKEQRIFWRRFGENADAVKKIDVVSAHLAGRFAAKEATIKAVTSSERLKLLETEILPSDGQGVYAVYPLKNSEGEDSAIAQVSISHEADYATAVCLAAN